LLRVLNDTNVVFEAVNAKTKDRRSPLHLAAIRGAKNILKYFLEIIIIFPFIF